MKRFALYATVATLGLITTVAQAQWEPTLVQAETEVRPPAADIRVQLPREITTETLQWLALEIDDIDVSEIVRLEESPQGFVVVVSPPQPLEAGSHRVRLVEYTPDGQILERGVWNIQTGGATGFAEKSLDIWSTADLGYRIEHTRATNPQLGVNPALEDDDYQGDGTTVVRGRLANDDWEVEGEASMLYNSVGVDVNNTQQFDSDPGNELEIGEYLISRRDPVSEINLGHHAINHDSLIMEDFYRRGVSANRSSSGGRAKGTLFAMRTEPTIGHRDIFGVEEVDSRVMGGVVSISPLSDQRALTVSVAGLGGKGNDENGASLAGRDVLAEGDAASISAESRLADDKLRLRGEYAKTSYDFDGVNGEIDKIDDDARMFLVEFAPMQGKQLGDSPANLTFGAEYQETGLFYKSIANSFLPADKELRRVYSDFRWGGFSLNASAGTEHDNVDDAPDLPRLNTDLYQLYASYTPQPEYDAQGNLNTPWYGQPSYSAALQYGRQDQSQIPDGFGLTGIDRRTRTGRISASFYYTDWNWYVGHSLGFEDDLTLQSPDIRNEISDIGLNVSFLQRVYLGFQFQYNRFQQSDGRISRAWLWSASLDAILIPDRLTGRLNYSLNLDRTTDDSFASDGSFVNVELDWQLVQPRPNRPGMSVWLRGDFQDFEDRVNPINDSMPSQVFVGISVDWTASYGRDY